MSSIDEGLEPTAAQVAADFPEVDIAIVCESTYPYLKGGLSAVVHQLCEAHPDYRIGIIHIAWDRSSPTVPLYDVPPQVQWVMPVYQSLQEHAGTFKAFRPRDSRVPGRHRRAVVTRLFDALDAHFAGDDGPLWALWDDGVNPVTRTFRLWPLLSSTEFMQAATQYFAGSGLSFADLFWQVREFFSLAYCVSDLHFPKAHVYHSHTTGAAGLLAAAAARQHGTSFFLTEHNLYVRDTINTLMNRSLATEVSVDEWRTITEYTTADFEPTTAVVDPKLRGWLGWFARSGVVAYRAADFISYLYPDAIREAAALGGPGEKSHVLPNGVRPADFAAARDEYRNRQERDADDRIWRLACAARVVPIKGQMDLLEALALLLEAGVTNWELDVMGPENEQPAYVEACKRRAHELGLDGRVRFLGTVNLRERFGGYDALVLPSHNEGQPIVVLEAMTVGLPTIGTYVGGMKQLVEDDIRVTIDDEAVLLGPCGLLAQPRRPEDLAAKLGRLLQDRVLYEALSRNAQERVERYFHLDSAMGMYRVVYSTMLPGGPDFLEAAVPADVR
ncbi:GT4 family glycosyltransferase PelF [Amnibacterium endophyticum]|uniref:GT4 family glycosyltransferase PelF n=1 Tax=Amnibacterium endophyticum TaxID=2109337 RepID=A0ABW4L9N0_9MICO